MQKGTRATLLQAKRKEATVAVPELDAEFTLRELSGTERDKFESWTFADKDGKRTVETMYLRARLVALCLMNGDGKRAFADDQIEELSDAVPSSVLNRLFTEAQKLNGLDGAAVEDAAKNSGSAATGASASDSPSH
jgi:hypothetical protein